MKVPLKRVKRNRVTGHFDTVEEPTTYTAEIGDDGRIHTVTVARITSVSVGAFIASSETSQPKSNHPQ